MTRGPACGSWRSSITPACSSRCWQPWRPIACSGGSRRTAWFRWPTRRWHGRSSADSSGSLRRHVVRVTRRRDETWAEVLERLHDEEALIVILPEGRMKRRTGLDLDGNPMTIRGGIADIIESVPDGRLFIGYSGGLHHVHAPGDRFPRPVPEGPARRGSARHRGVPARACASVTGRRGSRGAVIEDPHGAPRPALPTSFVSRTHTLKASVSPCGAAIGIAGFIRVPGPGNAKPV